ncbi:glycosyltransferase [Aeromicrobium sp. Leaf350]|uniref:glycosyltransferase n=1 Tax=Aeromicrobium sp. Leaf350 TaxID=2876565 RepID=UPI001E595ECE|nr:glycosyltransferase [Aeromicrobium sp. Leaf350]
MRILTVVPVMGVGGAEVVAATLVRAERDRGHEVLLASAGGFRADRLVADGVPHLEVPLASRRPLDLLRAVRALRRATRRPSRPDVVHAHNVKAAVVARLAVGRRVPVVVTVHGVPDGSWRTAGRLLTRIADAVVAVSPHVSEQLTAHGVPASRVRVVPNAVQPVARHDRAEARLALGLAEDAPVALCLARMVEQKRHDLLVAAWPEVVDRTDPSSVLIVAGDGPTRPSVEATAVGTCPPGSVQFLGARDDADLLLAAADVLVLPTDWEGLPISLLEAMSAEVPVVVSRVGGVVETLGSAVRLVEPGAVAPLAEALADLLGDPAARRALADRASALVADRFHPDRMVAGHEAVQDDLVNGSIQEARA